MLHRTEVATAMAAAVEAVSATINGNGQFYFIYTFIHTQYVNTQKGLFWNAYMCLLKMLGVALLENSEKFIINFIEI